MQTGAAHAGGSGGAGDRTARHRAESHDVVLRWVLAFLERCLRGNAGAAAFFAGPTPPGALVLREE